MSAVQTGYTSLATSVITASNGVEPAGATGGSGGGTISTSSSPTASTSPASDAHTVAAAEENVAHHHLIANARLQAKLELNEEDRLDRSPMDPCCPGVDAPMSYSGAEEDCLVSYDHRERKRASEVSVCSPSAETPSPEHGSLALGPLSSPTLTPLTRMAELPPDPDNGWRPSPAPTHTSPYYNVQQVHPLSVATAAMLNINGATDEQTATYGHYYDYKLVTDKDKEMWTLSCPSTVGGSTIVTSLSKSTNGLSEVGESVVLGTSHLGLLLEESGAGSGALSAASLAALHVKREPEDLTQPLSRKSAVVTTASALAAAEAGHKARVLSKVLSNGDAGSPPTVNNGGGGGGGSSSSSSSSGSGGVVLGLSHRKRDPDSPHRLTSTATASSSPTDDVLLSGGGANDAKMSSSVQPYPSHLYPATLSTLTQSSYATTATPDHVTQFGGHASTQNTYVTTPGIQRGNGAYTPTTDGYFREYFGSTPADTQYQPVRQALMYNDSADGGFGDRYMRPNSSYKVSAGLTVDLPSPDSGIGTDAITPRDQTNLQHQFEYTDMCQPPAQLGPVLPDPTALTPSNRTAGAPSTSRTTRPWHEFGRQNDIDKVQILKVQSNTGFKYYLESPISTSQRREDDRITYVNKGQFYGITLEYIPDPEKPLLKSQTVKSTVMLIFREEKSTEDEIKAWQFWHGRQHSVKQRILDADTKNSVGIIGCIEEIAHNAIAIYWNPTESPAKINVAVQCLSTDFSSQKGVKGLPLHLQIDTYEDPRGDPNAPVFHRGYCQIKVFCDKGAERKTRDEDRRAAKRKMTPSGRKKMDEMYHPPCERSEFYSMKDLTKPPVLFTPEEDLDKQLTSMDLQGFYNHDPENSSSLTNDEVGATGHCPLSTSKISTFALPPAKTPVVATTLKFHNNFPPDVSTGEKKDALESTVMASPDAVQQSRYLHPPAKRVKLTPPLDERVMIYVRQGTDTIYTPLHLQPPDTMGLLNAIESKYKILGSSIKNLYRQNRKGVVAKVDDDMLKYYCNEDSFIMEVKTVEEEDGYDLTLIEVSAD